MSAAPDCRCLAIESKENLFPAVIELVRGLFRGRLKSPGDYPGHPVEALVMFCARCLEILLYESSVQMLRVSMAETARFPEGAARYFEVMRARLGAYLKTIFELSEAASSQAAQRLLRRTLYPRLPRALFGIDPLAKSFDAETLSPDFDLTPIRNAVADTMSSLPGCRLPAGNKVETRPAARARRQTSMTSSGVHDTPMQRREAGMSCRYHDSESRKRLLHAPEPISRPGRPSILDSDTKRLCRHAVMH